MGSTQQGTSRVTGMALSLLGIVGFFWNPILNVFTVNTLHNLIHLVAGVLALTYGFGARMQHARIYNKVLGFVLVIIVLFGIFASDASAALLATNTADHVLHAVVAVILLLVGFFARD